MHHRIHHADLCLDMLRLEENCLHTPHPEDTYCILSTIARTLFVQKVYAVAAVSGHVVS